MIRIPGDKSISHRALLFAALASGESQLGGVLPGEDCRSTASALRAMGATIPPLPDDGARIRVSGVGLQGLQSPDHMLDCGNSGTTARLLLGLLSGADLAATLTGDESLRSRPMRRVTDPLGCMGATFEELGDSGRLPIRVMGGGIRPYSYRSPVASAQVKSAILLAGLTGGVSVQVVEPSQSRDHTERMLRRMGVRVVEESTPEGWSVRMDAPPVALESLNLLVPGDFSSAAFLIAFGLLGGAGGPLRIENVGLNPSRTGLLDVLAEMGGRIEVENLRETNDPSGEPAADLTVFPSDLRGASVGGELIPRLIDEIPILAALGAHVEGVVEIRDAAELRVKESDRIRVMFENLERLGVRVEERPDGLRVYGSSNRLQGKVPARHDHRIAMAFGILGALPGQQVFVDDPTVVDVSFPGFWSLLEGFTGARSD